MHKYAKLTFNSCLTLFSCLTLLTPNKVFAAWPYTTQTNNTSNVITITPDQKNQMVSKINSLQPGQTLVFKNGNYDDNNPMQLQSFSINGTLQNPIIIKAEQIGGAELGNIQFTNSSHVIVDGFVIKNQKSTRQNPKNFLPSIRIDNTNFLTFKNMTMHDNSWAFFRGYKNENLVIENSFLYNVSNPFLDGTNNNEGVLIFLDWSNKITIKNNKMYGFVGDAMQFRWEPQDSQATGDRQADVLIEWNEIYNNQGICSENALDLKHAGGIINIKNNKFYGFRNLDPNFCRSNNLLYASGSAKGAVLTTHEDPHSALLRISNNVFYDSGLLAAASTEGGSQTVTGKFEFFNNLVYSTSPYKATGTNNVVYLFEGSNANKVGNNWFFDIKNPIVKPGQVQFLNTNKQYATYNEYKNNNQNNLLNTCFNGLDDNNNGLIDLLDLNCTNPSDNELTPNTNPTPTPTPTVDAPTPTVATPTPAPTNKYDVTGDGNVDILDIIDVIKYVFGS